MNLASGRRLFRGTPSATAYPRVRRRVLPVTCAAFAWALFVLALFAAPALALKPITLTGEQDWIDISLQGERHEARGDTLNIETAPGPDGATARMAVRASTPNSDPSWIVFALHNPTNKAIEVWLTADRYNPIGAGVVWPDLDARRIASVGHSAGFAPERVRNDRIDIFRLTIERGQTITYAVELATEGYSRFGLWRPIEFEQRQRERQLFNGIMLGITGLLAVFLTAVFAANHKSIFPMAGLVAWCALGLLCVDFGFWHKLFQMRPEDNAQYRAAAEAALAASLVIFLAAFLRVNLWGGFARTLFLVWIVAQLGIVGVAVLDPRLAATVARLSLALIGVLGMVLILVLAVRGLDRALALMPTWILYLVWLFGAAVTLTGQFTADFAASGLVAGLVLILVLIGFTVTQYAFRSTEPLLGTGPGGQQLRLAALDRAGVAFWEWNIRRDEVRLDPDMELTLGLAAGELPNKVDDLLAYVHPADRERFRLELQAIRDRDGGALRTGIRMRHADSSYRWLEFEGASIPSSDRRNLRCVGLVRDTTDQKRAQERLLHNAVYDSLTSLPNRELFLDRLTSARRAVPNLPRRNIAVLVVDVDRFRSVNASFGLVVGDSIILTVSRRIARILGPDGNLARIGGDQFALFMTDYVDTREIATLAERLRLALRSPIRIAGQEVVLTGSIGIAIDDGTAERARDLMRYAETAMHRAKRLGSDRAEIYSPDMQSEQSERADIEADLGKAIEERRLTLLYQPIVNLSNDELVGFEAVVRWKHPRLGVIAPSELLAGSDRGELSTRLTAFVMQRAIADLARWQQELPRPESPMFVVVGLGSRQLLTTDLVQEVKQVKSRVVLPPGCLKLSVPEAVVMDNPEQASHVLDLLRDTGVDLWMDGFATGYSSLSYLGRFPFDTFRIDRTLVEWSGQGDRDASLVRSIVAVAHELGRKVMGQGVEAAEDAAFLRAIGCHYAQGFHYGEPMGEDETLRLLRLIRKSERRMRRRGMVRGQEKRKTGDGATGANATTGSDAMTSPATPIVAPAAQPAGSRPAPAPSPAPSQGQPYTQPPATRSPAGPMSTPWRPEGQPTGHPVRTMPPAGHRPSPGPAAMGPLPTPPGPISRPLSQPTTAAPSTPPTQPTGPRAPAPPQPPDVASTRLEASGRPPPDPLPPLREPPGPATTHPPQVAPVTREPQPGSVPTRPTLQRVPHRALSPAIAASLARLAGKSSEDAEGEPAASDSAGDDNPGAPPPPRGIKAAE